MSAQNNENSDGQASKGNPPTVEEQIQDAHAKLAAVGRRIYDRAMEAALKEQYDIAIRWFLKDMKELDKTVGNDNSEKLQSSTSDIKQFQLCVLGIIQEAKLPEETLQIRPLSLSGT